MLTVKFIQENLVDTQIYKREFFLKVYFARFIKHLGIGLFSLGLSVHASAGVVFSNFGPGLSYDTNNGNPVGDGFDGNIYAEGESFTLGANAIFGSLSIALSEVYTGSQGAPVTISLRADNGNSPGIVLESWSVAPGSLGLLGNNNALLVLNSALNLALLAEAEYWVTASLPDFGNTVAWNWNATGDMNAQAINDGYGWYSPSGLTPGAFQIDSLESTVPEPSTLALCGLAIAGLTFCSWRNSSTLRRR